MPRSNEGTPPRHTACGRRSHRADRSHLHARAPGRRPYGTFAEGQGDPGRYSDDDRPGSFGDGQAALPVDLDPGRFSAGMEELGDDDPEKRAIGSFGDEEPPS